MHCFAQCSYEDSLLPEDMLTLVLAVMGMNLLLFPRKF